MFMKELFDKKGVRVTHGDLLSMANSTEQKEHDPHDLNRFDPVMVLVEYMRIDNLRLIDFFQYLDTNSRERLSKSDFREGVAVNLRFISKLLSFRKHKYVKIDENNSISFILEFVLAVNRTSPWLSYGKSWPKKGWLRRFRVCKLHDYSQH